ncbi:MAG: hypothetical protein HZA03_01510 [Nitrospinae bacterium]|nr:hypothetical protein [Nitrospinota bacterium]
MTSEKSDPKPARLIIDGPRDGAANMAADEALFYAAANLPYAATLRLYSWNPPTLSLGRRQKLEEVNAEKCRALGIDVVKRIGGGAAVYHGDEITYCFVSRNDLLPIPTGEQWHAAFSLFLEKLGLMPDAGKAKSRVSHDGNACFACAAEDEPTVGGGKKFVGSARRKSKAVFLQHGSILLSPQPDFLCELVTGAETDASIGLKTLLPSLTRETAHAALIAAIEETFSLRFPPA